MLDKGILYEIWILEFRLMANADLSERCGDTIEYNKYNNDKTATWHRSILLTFSLSNFSENSRPGY